MWMQLQGDPKKHRADLMIQILRGVKLLAGCSSSCKTFFSGLGLKKNLFDPFSQSQIGFKMLR